ncbi:MULTISPECIES: acyltransferase family protein [Pantoea]|uniref:Acyltransferase 3 domain-containing protein n=1 Tax=Pantoea rwandensis TaxID=1076550 RepID=A0ABM5RIE2_9GAMM|nr:MULTISPECIES: acyltransferase [Pantoea]AIR85716.1 hypothetical protein LH22_09670 [Pantoea rwandensis]MBK0124930.1 acyltransferase [Pantoea sp. S61]
MVKKGKLNIEIEYLRFFAIVAVLLEHLPTLYIWSKHQLLQNINKYVELWPGVDLFFSISGYLITTNLLTHLNNNQSPTQLFRHTIIPFFVKRIYRLIPASWFWMFVVLFFSAFYNITNAFGEFRHNIIYCITIITFSFNAFSGYLLEQGYLPTYGPYWSLSLEEQFYFVAPFILLFMRTRWKIITFSIVAILLLYNVQQGDWSPNFRYHGLIFGVLLAILKLSLGSKIKPVFLRRWHLRYLVNTLLLFSLFAIPAALKGSIFLFGSLALTSTLLVYIASWDGGLFLSPEFEGILARSMRWIASRSYSIYLAHMPVIYLVQESTVRIMVHYGFAAGDSYLRSLWMTIFALGLIFISSELSYRYLEIPLRNKGRKVARKYEVRV